MSKSPLEDGTSPRQQLRDRVEIDGEGLAYGSDTRAELLREIRTPATQTHPTPPASDPRLPIDTVLVCAMPEEAQSLRENSAAQIQFPISAQEFIYPQLPDLFSAGATDVLPGYRRGSEGEKIPVLVVITNIGLAAAAGGLGAVLSHIRPARVIAFGTCGGLGRDVNVRDALVGDEYLFTSADATVFDYAPGQVPRQPERLYGDADLVHAAVAAGARAGLFASSDMFVTAANVEQVRQTYPTAVAAEMESAAWAVVCRQWGVPFVAIRAVSDLCGPGAGQQYHIEGPEAGRAFSRVVGRVLQDL